MFIPEQAFLKLSNGVGIMKIIGITGGIGSGKSRVLYHLKEEYNAYIVEADKLAKRLMMPGNDAYLKIVEAFPEVVHEENAPIDSKILAGIVYNDSDKLSLLNSIVHPAVKEYIKKDIREKAEEGNCRLYFIEAALLIEDGYKDICDEMWYIRTDLEVRIKRLADYRGMDREGAMAVIANQKPDEFYIKYSDFIIDNSGDFDDTIMQIRTKFIA